MNVPDATLGANDVRGPTVSGYHVGTATASTAAAASLDLGAASSLATPPPAASGASSYSGGRWVSFQARGGDVFVRFGATATTATTAGNTSTGFKIADGSRFDKWVEDDERYCDHIASASCTLFWWISSPRYRNRP